MTNKIIALAGLSGTGKSSLAKNIAHTYGFEVISVSQVLRKRAECEGRNLPMHLLRRGVKGTFEESRAPIMSDIKQKLEKSSVVIDGMYDYQFYKIIENTFGNNNLILIKLNVGIKERFRRLRMRGEGFFSVARDIVKIYIGVNRIMDETSININENSPNAALMVCKKSLEACL